MNNIVHVDEILIYTAISDVHINKVSELEKVYSNI